jgi:hypothetical protein
MTVSVHDHPLSPYAQGDEVERRPSERTAPRPLRLAFWP